MDMWNFLAQNPTFPVIVIATIVAISSLRSQRHLTRAKHTLDFDKEFKEKDKGKLLEARKVFDRLSWAELERLGNLSLLHDNNDFKAIVDALNIWEAVAIGIRNKVYSEKLLIEAYGTTVVFIYKSSIPFVKERQKKNSRLYTHFVWLGVRWSAEFSISLKDEEKIAKLQAAHEEELKNQGQLMRSQIREEIQRSLEKSNPGETPVS